MLAVLSFFVLSFIYFIRLFFPSLHLFYVPDFATSDVFNVSYALKDYLAQSLRTNELPFIAPLESHGYPLFAESQIGALNLFNLVLYRFLPPELAFNLTYPLSLGLLGSGMYLLGKLFSKRNSIAYFCAVSYMFSAIVLQQVVHQGIFQAMAFIPIVTYFFLDGLERNSYRRMIIAGFLAAQQFLFGHYFVSMGQQLLVLMCVIYHFCTRRNLRNSAVLLFWYGMIFVLVALPQLIQSAIFTIESNRQGVILRGVFPAAFFLTFFTPFPFGNLFSNPLVAHTFYAAPWDTNLFMGYGMLLIGFSAIAVSLVKKLTIRFPTLLLILFTVFFLFMLGDAPIVKNLTRIGVFNSVRGIYRMSIFLVFISILMAGTLINRFRLSRILIAIAVLLQIAGAFYHFFNYFPVIPTQVVHKKPLLTKYVKPNESVIGLGYVWEYKEKFIKQGYSNINSYLSLDTALEPHSQLVHGVKRCDEFYFSLYNPMRLHYLVYAIYTDTDVTGKKIISKKIESYLQLLGCNKIASVYPLSYSTSNTPGVIDKNLYVYNVPKVLPDYALTRNVELMLYEKDLLRILGTDKFSPSTVYLLSSVDTESAMHKDTNSMLNTLIDKPHEIQFTAKNTTSQFLFVRRLMYPGWHAYLDAQEVPIQRANILFMGISVPEGSHTIRFIYNPPYWTASVAAMVVGYAIFAFSVLSLRRSHSNRKTSGHPFYT